MTSTDTYGDSLINGILAGMKFRQQQSDLQLAKLQLADYENSAMYRESKRNLDLETQRAQLEREQLGTKTTELQRQLLEQELASNPAKTKAELDQRSAATEASRAATEASRASTEQTKQQTAFASETQPYLKSRLAAEALSSQSQAAKGFATPGLNLNDALSIAKNVLNVEQPAAQNAMAMFLVGESEAKNAELAQIRSQIDYHKTNAEGQKINNIGTIAQTFGSSAGQYIVNEVYGKDNPISQNFSKIAEGVNRKPAQLTPAENEESKAIGKSLVDLRSRIGTSIEEPADAWQKSVNDLADQKQLLAEINKDPSAKFVGVMVRIEETQKRLNQVLGGGEPQMKYRELTSGRKYERGQEEKDLRKQLDLYYDEYDSQLLEAIKGIGSSFDPNLSDDAYRAAAAKAQEMGIPATFEAFKRIQAKMKSPKKGK